MLESIIGISILLTATPIVAQHTLSDTLSFPFGLADWHRGDTVYLHSAGPTTLRRFYNKNLRGIYRSDDTPISGTVIISFYADSTGRFTGACVEDSTDPELAFEVLRVTRRLSLLPLVPTKAAGKPFPSEVRLKVVFRRGADISVPDDPNADLTVDVYGVQY